MTPDPAPASTSALLITPDCYQTQRWTLRRLRGQPVRDRLEAVFVAPSPAKRGRR